MRLRFTKMQGAGNDFVVLDATAGPLALTPDVVRRLADRHFGVGADQVLVVERSHTPGIDFGYRIFNCNGEEVEHCGNGARCFVRYVHARGLTQAREIKVQTLNKVLSLKLRDDGGVTVDMSQPVFELSEVPFTLGAGAAQRMGGFELWPLDGLAGISVAVLSMGNPHAVLRVEDVAMAPIAELAPRIEGHAQFPRRVNAGFMQVINPGEIALRVYERGAGETLACGTGACAAVVAGIRLGWLSPTVQVHTRGGDLQIEWAGENANVLMTGPAQFVFEGQIDL